MAKTKITEKETKGQKQGESQSLERRGELARREPFGLSPFGFTRRFGEEMDRLFEDFGFGRGWLTPRLWRGLEGREWLPQVETFEREGQFVLRADLPGLTKDDVKVEVTDDSIIIQGERHSEEEHKREGYYRSERTYGKFYRRLPLPEGVNAENANASFRNGVLEITMQAPKREEQKARRLEIRGEAEERPKAATKAAGR
jgi:HSP20 family protein